MHRRHSTHAALVACRVADLAAIVDDATMSEEPTLERLASKDAIHDVLMRYCRGIDRLDVELLKSCYHEDSWDDHGHYKGGGHAFAQFIAESLAEIGRAHV